MYSRTLASHIQHGNLAPAYATYINSNSVPSNGTGILQFMYGAECWTVTKKEEQIIEQADMSILRRIKGVTLTDKVNGVVIRKELGVNNIHDKEKRD